MSKEKGNMPARLQVWVSEVPWEYPTEDTVVEILGEAAIPKSSWELFLGGLSGSI